MLRTSRETFLDVLSALQVSLQQIWYSRSHKVGAESAPALPPGPRRPKKARNPSTWCLELRIATFLCCFWCKFLDHRAINWVFLFEPFPHSIIHIQVLWSTVALFCTRQFPLVLLSNKSIFVDIFGHFWAYYWLNTHFTARIGKCKRSVCSGHCRRYWPHCWPYTMRFIENHVNIFKQIQPQSLGRNLGEKVNRGGGGGTLYFNRVQNYSQTVVSLMGLWNLNTTITKILKSLNTKYKNTKIINY